MRSAAEGKSPGTPEAADGVGRDMAKMTRSSSCVLQGRGKTKLHQLLSVTKPVLRPSSITQVTLTSLATRSSVCTLRRMMKSRRRSARKSASTKTSTPCVSPTPPAGMPLRSPGTPHHPPKLLQSLQQRRRRMFGVTMTPGVRTGRHKGRRPVIRWQ